MHITEMKDLAIRYLERRQEVLDTQPPEGFSPYPYESIGNIWHLDTLLDEEHKDLFSTLIDQVVADVGAADGDMAFLLEQAGIKADVIDNPPTNWNGLQGARYFKKQYDSNVDIYEVDLDSQFTLPRERYGLIILLGILYHLKNPFFVLEAFARHSSLLLLSTRIARNANEGTDISELPLAYLVAPEECNNDPTNFWVFSETGLKRLLDRTGWDLVQYKSVGDTKESNPFDSEHDERAFVLARSRHFPKE